MLKVKKTIFDADDKDTIRVIEAEMITYRQQLESFTTIGLNQTVDPARAQQLMKEDLDPHYDTIYTACTELLEKKVTEGEAVQTQLTFLCIFALIMVVVVVIIAVLLSTKLGKNIARGIAEPLYETVTAAKSIAEGNLDISVSTESDDEVGDLNRVFVEMSATLKGIIQDINELLQEMSEGNFDIEIVERHHNQKIDAPSGTALAIADAIDETLSYPAEYVYDRHAVRRKRKKMAK